MTTKEVSILLYLQYFQTSHSLPCIRVQSGDKMKSIMDTSTPVKKKKSETILDDIRRKALKNDLEQTSNVSPSSAAVDDAEFVYSQQPIDTRLNKSEELFP